MLEESLLKIIGVQNEIASAALDLAGVMNLVVRDYTYGNRESGEGVIVATAIDDMHRVYPRDRDLPTILLECYRTLGRMTTSAADAAAAKMRVILTVEYPDTPRARTLLAPSA